MQWIKVINKSPELDTEEACFSLKDMKLCWIICDELHADRSGHSIPEKYFTEFIKSQFGIDIN